MVKNSETKKRIRNQLLRYVDMSRDRELEEVTVAEIRNGIEFKGSNVLILIFAIFIASLGLNINSTAVIIGAMLISPLMGPIMGVGLGLGINDFELIKRSARNLLVATVFSVVTSTIYFLLSPLSDARSELLARTSPTLYDVLIALFGGAAGIIATSTKQKGNVLPGVSIATALMPPLCTAGFGLATGNMNYFLGALYLFIINSVFIAFATTIGVKLMKFSPKVFIDKQREKRVSRWIYTMLLLIVIPSVVITYNMVRFTYFESTAHHFLNAEFNTAQTQILKKHAYIENGHNIIEVSLVGKEISADSILMIERRMPQYGLAGAQLRVSQGYKEKQVDINQISGKMFEEIYQDGQRQILQQGRELAALHQELSHLRRIDSLSIELAPEIKTLFPQVSDIALAHTVFNNMTQMRLDTTLLVVLNYVDPQEPVEREQFINWLKARLSVEQVRIVEESGENALSNL